MAKKLFKRHLPDPRIITQNRWLKKLGPRLQAPDLWHINRKSCSGGAALGVFCAFIPVPFQMLLAAVGAVLLRYNILIAVPIVWLSNPLTIPAIFYLCYQVGTLLLGIETHEFNFDPGFDWLTSGLIDIWQPFLLGCLVMGLACSLSVFGIVRLFWRYHVRQQINQRRQRHSQTVSKKIVR